MEIWKTPNDGDIKNTEWWRYEKHRMIEILKTQIGGDMETQTQKNEDMENTERWRMDG